MDFRYVGAPRQEGMHSWQLTNSYAMQGYKGKEALDYWTGFVQRFFSQKGIYRYTIHMREHEDQNPDKQYEITYPALARYFYTHFESGVKTMQLIMNKGITDRALPNDCHIIENRNASLTTWFDGGSHVSHASAGRGSVSLTARHRLWRLVSCVSSLTASKNSISSSSKQATTKNIFPDAW